MNSFNICNSFPMEIKELGKETSFNSEKSLNASVSKVVIPSPIIKWTVEALNSANAPLLTVPVPLTVRVFVVESYDDELS
ncbi:hypothetical protein TVAG_312190 [Trichomonas vaginalis G3]|uniref:Uncharacterized protein n=1 Tax=Trichomonas vaginalis (strain ATCC PRA-98 / G3) TaxID=412133 RepID=A2EHM4_TRIV3|nr:hypothetical protein TVAGG3_0242390 [Trichomonas vaginalis G3]EAY07820.1 hypothetical protein TVAG_312190 [Trichomonas vaginalis G3]KAI5553430.1 hypothetical protein TVAGG3_0242390 [Trichomonas vaginalis G3]|eukprot:XP_001320043.1 hypothetical protein [Trichomonas vaginalis G3]